MITKPQTVPLVHAIRETQNWVHGQRWPARINTAMCGEKGDANLKNTWTSNSKKVTCHHCKERVKGRRQKGPRVIDCTPEQLLDKFSRFAEERIIGEKMPQGGGGKNENEMAIYMLSHRELLAYCDKLRKGFE